MATRLTCSFTTIAGGLLLCLLLAAPSGAAAETMLDGTPPFTLSDGSGEQVPDLNAAAKVKINRLPNGMLVSVFGDGVGPDVYDVKSDSERPARDIFVRTCNSKTMDCADSRSWSAARNLSNTANLSSRMTQWQGADFGNQPYYGDSEKPNIFKVGTKVIVTWVDHYCPGGEQGAVSYLERDDREIAYACTYVVRSLNGGQAWSEAQQLTTGYRDAKSDVPRGSSAAWAITWQADPAGLQLGDAEGPGHGGSGAKASHGTDVWYTRLSAADFADGVLFPEPVRLTDNFTRMDRKRGAELDAEAGQTAASRPNLFVAGSMVQVAYEETKGSAGIDQGKVIRYHVFPWNSPPTSCKPDLTADDGCARAGNGRILPASDDPARMGCILSDPAENARRVRFFTQGTPGTNSGVKFHIFWKQGLYDGGGPSDIVARSGIAPADETGPSIGLRYQDLVPPVAVPVGPEPDGCNLYGDEDLVTGAFANPYGMNLSSDTELGGNLAAHSDDNPLEDARAHRGLIKGDFIALGYSYTPDWAVARYTDLEHYNFWMRTSTNGGLDWNDPKNLSADILEQLAEEMGLGPKGVNVKEPRIVKTPGHGPGCPSGDPAAADTSDASDCSNGNTFLVAFGAEDNVYEFVGGARDLDIFVFRTTDKGQTFEQAFSLEGDGALVEQGESQLQITPDGDTVFSVYFAHDTSGSDVRFSLLNEIEYGDVFAPVDDDDSAADDDDSAYAAGSCSGYELEDDTSERSTGCTAARAGATSGSLFALLMLLGLRRRRG